MTAAFTVTNVRSLERTRRWALASWLALLGAPAGDALAAGPASGPAAGPAAPARALAVEAGATSELGRSLCGATGDPRVTVEAGRVAIPKGAAFARFTLLAGDCLAPEPLAVAVVPSIPRGAAGAWLYVDEARLQVRGAQLSRATVWWRVGANVPWSADVCVEVRTASDGTTTCELPVPAAAAAAALAGEPLEVFRLPPGMPPPGDADHPEVWSRAGERVPLELLRVPVQRLVVDPPLLRTGPLEAWRDRLVLPLTGRGVVAAASCYPGSCWLSDDGASLVVEPSAVGDSLAATLRLDERVWLRTTDALVNTTVVNLPLARCELRPLVAAVLGGTEEHRLPLQLGARCPAELGDLAVETNPPTGAWVERSPSPGVLDVRLAHVPARADVLEVRLVRGSTRQPIASTRVSVRTGYDPTRIALFDPELGELPVIPTNRDVRVQFALPDTRLAGAVRPVGLPGYYTMRTGDPERDGAAEPIARGEARSAGAVPIRFAYRPLELGEGEPLVTFESQVHFSVAPVNVPVSLAPDAPVTAPLFTVRCALEDADGHPRETDIPTGALRAMPFAARGACHLRIDHKALPVERGRQRIRLDVRVSDPSGDPRDGGFSQVLSLAPSPDVDTVWLGSTGILRPFDHVTVRLSHDGEPGHYASAGEVSALPARQYSMIFGNERMRIYGSAAVPTGLYRITHGEDAGLLDFSAGVLARLAPLDREGRQYPIDLQFGIFGTGLSNDAHVSLVAGPGFTVPLLNPHSAGRAAIGLHAWLELAPTRSGSIVDRLAFIFGPSISLGDFGTNL